MTTLEKVLGTALVGVTALCATVIIQTVKHIRSEQKMLAEVQEKCGNIIETLDKEIEEMEESV